MDDDDTIDGLASEFSRLREEIAAELRRTAGVTQPAPPPAPASRFEYCSRAPPPPTAAAARPRISAPADEEIPSFYALRESLLGRVASAPGPPLPPTSDHPLSSPFVDLSNTVTLSGSSQTASAMAPPAPTPSMGSAAASTTLLHRASPAKMREPAHPAQSAPAANTVMLQARKPGSAVMAAMDNDAAIAACGCNAPRDGRGAVPTAAPATATVHVTRPQPEHPAAASDVRVSMRSNGGGGFGGGASTGDGDGANAVMFGHLAMRAALKSHRLHYEDARSRLPTVARHRPTSGVLGAPPPARPASARGQPPHLATAARARPKAEGSPWPEASPIESLTSLKASVAAPRPTSASAAASRKPSTKAPAGRGPGGGGGGAAKARIPIQRPVLGGSGGGGGVCGEPSNQAPLMPVTAAGVAPRMDTIRANERLVTAIAGSAAGDARPSTDRAEAAADAMAAVIRAGGGARGAADDSDGEGGSGCSDEGEGRGGVPPGMSAQQAWAAAVEGEARQAQLIGSMAARSAALFRTTMEAL